jgi:hypothetical protein
MQRSLTYQNDLIFFIGLPFFFFYEALSSIYLVLPPMFAVLFLSFEQMLHEERMKPVIALSAVLLIVEANKGFAFLSSVLFFILLARFVTPGLRQYIVCRNCLKFIFVVIAYVGYFMLMSLISNIFMLESPMIDGYLLYYIFIEFLIVMLL